MSRIVGRRAWLLLGVMMLGVMASRIVSRVQAQPRAAELAAPASVPVALGTRAPEMEWGTVERTPAQTTGRSAGAKEAPPDPHAKLQVSGIHGTLNQDDVHQTMDARQRPLRACTTRARTSSGWISGQLRFAFRVDAEGRVVQLRPLVSNVGHYELEQCLMQVLLETQFPKPAGRAAAEFSWGMNVEPATAHGLPQLRASAISGSVRKHKRELKKQCDLPRRSRLRLTAYLSPSGQVLSSGGYATSAATQSAVPCVLEQVAKWRLPKQKRVSKVSFDVR
ncbi:MAG: hypothetical protein ABW321_25365 [Polyangiales bacterium]